jgi:protein tyrosine phosphatase
MMMMMIDDSSFGKPVYNIREHIKKLFQKIKNGAFADADGFDLEFSHIEKKTEKDLYFGDYRSALKPCNRIKNRYSNVLPLERTRVVLKPIEGGEGSDYINASLISGETPESQNAYICTQGPMQDTFNDFWRMVWEQNSNIIVMLTKEVENLKVKCARYWPEKDAQIYGNLRVTVLATDNLHELITRTFLLEDTKSGDSRVVTQFQYISWPDHGLPVSTSAFLELIHMVDRQKRSGPIIVHCSAGIGRSGTFCTVHTTIAKFKADLVKYPDTPIPFNILQTVIFMRQQRPGMVQTKEQYMFCYLSIEEETSHLSKKLHINGLRSSLNYSQ